MQTQENVWDDESLVDVLKKEGAVIMPTDTIYGIIGCALNESTVNRIYAIRKRNPDKPCIILLGNIQQLEKFSIVLNSKQKAAVKEYWPGPVSIILDCPFESFAYLHRGTNTLAFRLPSPKSLRDLLIKVGPLIAPSANLEGMPPAQNIREAKKYFGDSVDLYVDGEELTGKASKIIKLHGDGTASIIRN